MIYRFLFAFLLFLPLLVYFVLGGANFDLLDLIWYIGRRMDASTNPVLTGYLLNGYLIQLPFTTFLAGKMNVFAWRSTPSVKDVVLMNLLFIFVLLTLYTPVLGGNFLRFNSDIRIVVSSAVMYGCFSPFAIFFVLLSIKGKIMSG